MAEEINDSILYTSQPMRKMSNKSFIRIKRKKDDIKENKNNSFITDIEGYDICFFELNMFIRVYLFVFFKCY